MTDQTLATIRDILHSSTHAVFFGGAGVSTDSGIPDFRGTKGLYSKREESNEYFLSNACLTREPERFFEFYRTNMVYPDAAPNATHNALARLEERGIIKAVITQNIDGLHQTAGSKNVIELHGTISRCYCMRCGKVYGGEYANSAHGIPKCNDCGGTVRPDVTLYGEALDAASFSLADEHIAKADVLIAGGTSLTVHPAASLVGGFRGKHLIIVNYSPTPYDGMAEFALRESLAKVFEVFL